MIMKICFVCYGNICRSVMAEYILKEEAKRRGREDVSCFSRAQDDHTEGMDIYYAAKECLEDHGIPYGRHKAKMFTETDYEEADIVYVMDEHNKRGLGRTVTDREKKIRKLLDRDVADPWYTRDFEKTYRDLLEGIERILEETV